MSTTYKGWKVPGDIIIVSKECSTWDYKNGGHILTGEYQGYVVDPDNEAMLQNALGWAKWTEYIGKYDTTTRRYEQQIEHEGVQHRFKNEGFVLELLESADGSSQGGKLSFWNCKISKDGKSFIVGINSDYLLEILRYNDFVKGVCQSTMSFARCKGGVGMLNEAMPSYQQFLQDEEQRAAMKKGKTKKREPGHLYKTLTEGHVFFGTYYRWYEPVYSENCFYKYARDVIGYRKLEKPIAQYWQPSYNEEYKTKSDYLNKWGLYWDDTTPARTDCGPVVELDISDEEVLERHLRSIFKPDAEKWSASCVGLNVGVSLSKDSYTLPDEIRKWITDRGFKVWD